MVFISARKGGTCRAAKSAAHSSKNLTPSVMGGSHFAASVGGICSMLSSSQIGQRKVIKKNAKDDANIENIGNFLKILKMLVIF